MIDRRFLLGATGLVGLTVLWAGRSRPATAKGTFPVSYDEAEWHKRLNTAQYAVLRDEGTERPFTSPLNDEHRHGTFACAGCGTALFTSETKFDSGTGWPSFFAPIESGVATSRDTTFGMARTEVHCKQCGGHLGHVFNDGPAPTGLRYCMNGVAMTFKTA